MASSSSDPTTTTTTTSEETDLTPFPHFDSEKELYQRGLSHCQVLSAPASRYMERQESLIAWNWDVLQEGAYVGQNIEFLYRQQREEILVLSAKWREAMIGFGGKTEDEIDMRLLLFFTSFVPTTEKVFEDALLSSISAQTQKNNGAKRKELVKLHYCSPFGAIVKLACEMAQRDLVYDRLYKPLTCNIIAQSVYAHHTLRKKDVIHTYAEIFRRVIENLQVPFGYNIKGIKKKGIRQ